MGVLTAALRRRHPADGGLRGSILCRRDRNWFVHLLGGAAEITVVAINDGADSIAEIAQQVPAVRHLDRFRRALADTVGVGTSTVARDNLNPGMLTKPVGQRLSLAIWEQVYDLVALEVDDDGAVPMPAPPSPIIDAENLRRRWRRLRDNGFGYHPQQRVGAGRYGKSFSQPRSGLTAEGKCDVTL